MARNLEEERIKAKAEELSLELERLADQARALETRQTLEAERVSQERPKNLEEFERRFTHNTKMDGSGMETMMHIPCPFCAAPDFSTFALLDMAEVVKLERICAECDRGCRLEMKPIAHGGVRWEFVLTQGEDIPEWLPQMRRLETKPGGDA